MTRGTIYTDPHSGTEMLLVEHESRVLGVTYDPKKTTAPVPWTSDCRHCLAGRQLGLSVHERREIRFLLSRKIGRYCVRYKIPSASRPRTVIHWTRGKKQTAKVADYKKSKKILLVTTGNPLKCEGDLRSFQSPILRRCLRLLFSGRPASQEEISACLRPLRERSGRKRGRGGRRLPCKNIDWTAETSP